VPIEAAPLQTADRAVSVRPKAENKRLHKACRSPVLDQVLHQIHHFRCPAEQWFLPQCAAIDKAIAPRWEGAIQVWISLAVQRT